MEEQAYIDYANAVDDAIEAKFGFSTNSEEFDEITDAQEAGLTAAEFVGDLKLRFLFNCCTSNKEPDWSQYKNLEIAPVREGEEDGKYCEAIMRDGNASEAAFWTVYARDHDDMATAITDASAERVAIIARELGIRSNLPVSFYL